LKELKGERKVLLGDVLFAPMLEFEVGVKLLVKFHYLFSRRRQLPLWPKCMDDAGYN
jgi:hypothetical protein